MPFKRPSFIPTPEQRAARKAERMARWEAQSEARQEHQARLERAAGISSLTLRCHKDTWARVTGRVGHPSARPRDLGDGLIEVSLSGPYVIDLLNSASNLTAYTPPAIHAVMSRLNRVLVAVVDQVDPDAPARPLPPVVLDDQAAAPIEE